MYYYYWIFYRFILLFILQEKEWNLNKFVELFILFFWLFWNLIFKFLVWPYELLRLSFVFPTTVIIDVKNKRETRVAWLTEEKLFVCLCAWLFIAAVVGGSVPPCESKKQNWQVVYDWILKFCVRPVFHENECCPSPISRRLISFPSHWLSCVIPCRFFFFLFSPMIFTDFSFSLSPPFPQFFYSKRKNKQNLSNKKNNNNNASIVVSGCECLLCVCTVFSWTKKKQQKTCQNES